MIITENDGSRIIALKQYLMKTLQMKDPRPLHYVLGLGIHRSSTGIRIHQKKYAKDLISLAHLTNIKVTDAPLEIGDEFQT